jgi:hypothetical protein
MIAMMISRRTWRSVVNALLVVACCATAVFAQDRGGRRNGPGGANADGVTPGEIQRLFDAYVVMQAQQDLQLSDEQYPKFLAKMKALQAARQRGLQERLRIMQDLRKMGDGATLDETQARNSLKMLADLDARTAADVREALAGIDQVLDVRQQVRFRIFEEQMERRKVDLLVRARQNRSRSADQR